MITLRATLLLLVAAPLWAVSAWVPSFRWIALAYGVMVLAVLLVDRRAAGTGDQFVVRREHDNKLSLGADNPVRVIVRNRHNRPITFWVRDEPPDAWVETPVVLRGDVAARATWSERYSVHPLQRGDYEFGDYTMRWLGPLRLFVRQRRIAATAPVKVYPNLLNVRRYDLLLRRNRLQELGLRNTRMFGQGTEFELLRDYVADDDFRRIDWKATARRHRPVTRQYQTERSQMIMVVIDIGRMMQSPVENMAKLDYVINSALFLSYVATGMGDKVGLMTFADDVGQFLSPKQGRAQFYRILEQLYAVAAQPVEPDYRRALAYLGAKQRRRALTVIFTDLSGGITMQDLTISVTQLARRSLPLVVMISDPDVVAATRQRPVDSIGVYQQAAATQLLDERRLMFDRLQRNGVHTLDVPANQLSPAVINRYLQLKGKTLL